MTGIAEWLASIGLGEYAQRFGENAIDLSVVRDLTEQDLKDLGVLLGHRRKMLRAIAELKGDVLRTSQAGAKPAPRDGAERRQLTVMFCDLVGSSGLSLVDAVATLRTDIGAELQVRVGIATGMVVVGDLTGEGAAKEQAVIGETPNLAARLQALAEPGTVLISESTHRLTDGHFEYHYLGPVALKGWADLIPAWQVLGATGVESRFEAQHKARLTPLIGRDEEFELLLRRWQHAKRGEGCVVLLTGQPGIGKSHIALALERGQSSRLDAADAVGHHHSGMGAAALGPIDPSFDRVTRCRRNLYGGHGGRD